MKRVIIDIHDNYADVLSVTVAGHNHLGLNVSTNVIDINKNDYIIFDKDGIAKHEKEVEE